MSSDTPAGFRDRFNTLSGGYARFRPQYPDEMVASLAAHITDVPVSDDAPVLDVGCGTGIFTRQLAKALPPSMRILGIEPAENMRDAAIGQTNGFNIAFLDGSAESLPVGNGAARAIIAATAAHWFERPIFYAEATRALAQGGILAIIEYVRDTENSPAAAAIEGFLAREGGPKAYERPDYVAELEALPGLEVVEVLKRTVTLPLDVDGFVGLALSSSHAKAVVSRLGETDTKSALVRVGAGLAGADGRIPYGYRFQMFVARKRQATPRGAGGLGTA
ncbi:class I SAM-dependent methyltransferase [Agrobacterium tumefaciens]|uniref:Class I SAM-dependent methyltransferase n=2 Tax=Agrobacterium tumefaciens TaxID=358 RepID=A0AAP9J978_AGRTU|nr:class I SAM-dependent methyltransferase [Agrobacterium tumefaciens]QDY97772.2 class I SAM-dependent methyltransferase [Agrobacterium tumefaciens]UXS12894.1 class I SAM-dependent methyltransferase [Agrobacterium tumefaciens]UXS20256.1 class I SAM-dependent methyltransferase [Agrobacterium tumefaciens]UXS27901.1 class I SAM-dependent methyltransferase [Agrobacterium tumefaciens]UXS35477.1 class I SAM-dependent methyltransferase [Agrobacterium tumefaciens]